MEINLNIVFRYITMSENVSKNLYNNHGKPTIKHWNLTKKYLSDKIIGKAIIYAVTLHKGKELCDEGSDDEFYHFIENLIK